MEEEKKVAACQNCENAGWIPHPWGDIFIGCRATEVAIKVFDPYEGEYHLQWDRSYKEINKNGNCQYFVEKAAPAPIKIWDEIKAMLNIMGSPTLRRIKFTKKEKD